MNLTFDNVTKLYGPVIGVNGIHCEIGPGLTGLIGVNGAGKSTLLKLASGQLRPTQGCVRIGRERSWSSAAKAHMGYSPELNRFYEDMTGWQFVYAMARLSGFTARESRRRTDTILADVGMADRAGRRLGGCSHGMRQRVKLAQAMVHDPDVLLLDEPLAGIDPGGRREMHAILRGLAERGKTVLISSHILGDVEHLANRIVMVARGRIIASGGLAEIRQLIDDQPFTVAMTATPPRKMAALLIALADVRSVDVRGTRIQVRTRNPGQFFQQVNELVLSHSIDLHAMQTIDAGAEAVFGYLHEGLA